MSRAKINSPEEIRGYFSSAGRLQSATTPSTKTLLRFSDMSPSVIQASEETSNRIRFTASVSIQGLPAGTALPAGVRLQEALLTTTPYRSLGWTALAALDRSTNTIRVNISYDGRLLDHESDDATFYIGLRLTLTETPSTAEAERTYSIPVHITDFQEGPHRTSLAGPVLVQLNANDNRPVITDLSRYFANTDTSDPTANWQLVISTPLPAPPVATATIPLDNRKSLSLVPVGTSQLGKQTMQVQAQDTRNLSLQSASLNVEVDVSEDLHPVSWAWAISNTDGLADFERDDTGSDKILLNPGADGSSTALALGTWRATPASGGTLGAQTYTISDFEMLTGTQAITEANLAYDSTTGNLTADFSALAADVKFQFRLNSEVAATSDAAGSSTYRTIEVRAGWKPVISFTAWQHVADLPEGHSAGEEDFTLATIGYSATGLPPGDPDWILRAEWQTHDNGDTSIRVNEEGSPSGPRGSLDYYGHGELRSDATRISITATLTLIPTGSDHTIEPASATTPSYTIKVVPPAPTFTETEYAFNLLDGFQPTNTNQAADKIGTITAKTSSSEYTIGAYRVVQNSGDAQREFGANATSGDWYYTGPSAASISVATAYNLVGGSVQLASDGDESPVGTVPVKVSVIPREADTVSKNPDWRPPGGITRSINIGEETDIDARHAWRVPAGATQSISGTASPTSIISSTDNDSVFAITGLSIGTATLTLRNLVTFADGTTQQADDWVITIHVAVNAIATPFKWLRRTGTAGSYVYTEITSLTSSIAENSLPAEFFTGNRIYFWCPDLQDRDVDFTLSPDGQDVFTFAERVAQIPVPGQQGNQTAIQMRLTGDGREVDYEMAHRFALSVNAESDPHRDGNTFYQAFTEELPITFAITDENELPIRQTGYVFPNLTGRVGATAPIIELAPGWRDPEGRSLVFEVTSSNTAAVSGQLVEFGQAWQPQYNAAGTSTISVRCNDGTSPTRWVVPATFTITVEAAALAEPSFSWQNPTGNIAVFTSEDAPVGTKIVRNIWAQASSSAGVVLGDITYSLAEAPPDLLPDADDVRYRGMNFAWWREDKQAWYVGGGFDGQNMRQGMRSYDRFGVEIPIPNRLLRPGYWLRPSNPPAYLTRNSSFFTTWYDAIDDPTSTDEWAILAGGYGQRAIGTALQSAETYIARFTGIDLGPVGTNGAYIGFDNFIYGMAAEGDTAASLKVWATKALTRVVVCYNLGAAAANTAAAQDTASSFTVDSAIADQPEAMRLNNERDTLYIVCRKGTDYTLRAWNWPARTRNADKDVINTEISGTAWGMEIVGDWAYVLHNRTASGGGIAITYIPIGD